MRRSLVTIVKSVLKTTGSGGLAGVVDAGKDAAKQSLPKNASKLGDFFDELKDYGNEWAQNMVARVVQIDDRGDLLKLAASFDYGRYHGVKHYLPLVENLIRAYERSVLPIGSNRTGWEDMGKREIRNTQVALVKNGKRYRRAIVESTTMEGYGTSMVDQIPMASVQTFVRWVDDEVAELAESRQVAAFGSDIVVDAKDLKVRDETTGKETPAHGANSSFDHWMSYGDDHALWPET